jgi:hypothetical protein
MRHDPPAAHAVPPPGDFASHFLGHIPVHTVLAFVFIGAYHCLSGAKLIGRVTDRVDGLSVALLFFVALSLFLSLVAFGTEDTLDSIAQRKQGVGMFAEGGYWNLHLPSTLLLLPFIPLYIGVAKRAFKKTVVPNTAGLGLIAMGFVFILLVTYLVNANMASALRVAWTDPRYLAHSVRELATFPLTYFPIPLYFLLTRERNPPGHGIGRGNLDSVVPTGLALIFLAGLAYQTLVSLAHGIGNLAQKPIFARDGTLSIPYLLASHYFEHFLDTIFFTLACLLLHEVVLRKNPRFGIAT